MLTANEQLVSAKGDDIVIQNPIAVMSKEEAIRHACWILVLASPDRAYLAQQIAAIENT